MKKVFGLFSIFVFCFILTGCGSSEKNIKGSLNDIMDRLYEGVIEENGSTDFERIELTSENFEYHTGIELVNYKEALVSETKTRPLHTVILIRLEDEKDVDSVVAALKKSHDPEEWLCGIPDYIFVLSKGDLVALILGYEPVLKVKENFENLK